MRKPPFMPFRPRPRCSLIPLRGSPGRTRTTPCAIACAPACSWTRCSAPPRLSPDECPRRGRSRIGGARLGERPRRRSASRPGADGIHPALRPARCRSAPISGELGAALIQCGLASRLPGGRRASGWHGAVLRLGRGGHGPRLDTAVGAARSAVAGSPIPGAGSAVDGPLAGASGLRDVISRAGRVRCQLFDLALLTSSG